MKKVLAVLFAMLPMLAFAQSASMMAMAQAELQKRGLSETEVRTRLLEEGIDVDNISPTEPNLKPKPLYSMENILYIGINSQKKFEV